MSARPRLLFCSAALLLGACLPKPKPAPMEADYRPIPLSKALKLSNIGQRVRCAVVYGGIEELVLDLPEGYEDWTRLIVADPAAPGVKIKNAMVSSKQRQFLAGIDRGEPLELFALAIAPEEGYDEQAATAAILQVEKILRPGQAWEPEADLP